MGILEIRADSCKQRGSWLLPKLHVPIPALQQLHNVCHLMHLCGSCGQAWHACILQAPLRKGTRHNVPDTAGIYLG